VIFVDGVAKRTGPDAAAIAAADRLHALLEEAKENGHYVNGWYAYMDKRDVERVIAAIRR
jgi:hypothetical protein